MHKNRQNLLLCNFVYGVGGKFRPQLRYIEWSGAWVDWAAVWLQQNIYQTIEMWRWFSREKND
jgi:hypothetical protein